MTHNATNDRAVVRQWLESAPELDAIRLSELRTMTDAQALAAADALLSLVGLLPPPRNPGTSGLIEQQRIFALAR